MTTTPLNYEELILKGIMSAGGLPKDIEYVKPEWLTHLGTKAANLGADLGANKRMKFPSWIVKPICDIEEALKRGHYTGHYNYITKETVKLPKAKGKKRVYAVLFNEILGEAEYINRLAARGLKPCKNSPSYLAGLMAHVTADQMREELEYAYFVAAEPGNPSSVFHGQIGNHCFLSVRQNSSNRLLGLTSVDFETLGVRSDSFELLAEKM